MRWSPTCASYHWREYIGICGRWVIPLVFCVRCWRRLARNLSCDHWGRWGPRIAVVLLGVGLVDSWVVGSPNYRYLFHYHFDRPPSSSTFRQFWVDTPIFMTYIAQANMGSVNCQGFGYNVPQNKMLLAYNQQGYRGEYFMTDPGTVAQTEWTPNRLAFDVSATAPTTLVINQNFDIRLARGVWKRHDDFGPGAAGGRGSGGSSTTHALFYNRNIWCLRCSCPSPDGLRSFCCGGGSARAPHAVPFPLILKTA